MADEVLVTGASGNVGRRVVGVLQRAGVPVRAALRRPGAGAPGSTVAFDFVDRSTWPAAFQDVRVMFLVRPPAMGRVRRDLLPAVEAAQRYGVQHVVFLSLQGVDRNRVVPHAAVESWLRGSGLGWTFVRPSYFTQNLSTAHAADIRDRDLIRVPAGSGRTAFVDLDDVAAVAAAALVDPSGHDRRSWTVTGAQALTYREVADLLTSVLGRPITYQSPGLVPYLRHAHGALGMPWGMAAITAAIYSTARLGLAASLTDDVQRVLGRAPIDVADTLARERSAWTRPAPTAPGQREGGTP